MGFEPAAFRPPFLNANHQAMAAGRKGENGDRRSDDGLEEMQEGGTFDKMILCRSMGTVSGDKDRVWGR